MSARILNMTGWSSLFAIGLLTAMLPQTASATCVPTPYIGSMCITAANFCPRNYAEANGTLLPISQNQALFALIGCTYGGDCRTTMALPDMRSRVPVHVGTGGGLTPVQLGQKSGVEYTVMNDLTLPSHNHEASTTVAVNARTTDAANQNEPTNNILGHPGVGFTNDRDIYSTLTPNASLSSEAAVATTQVLNSGGSQDISLRNPYLGLRYCIALQGLFPSRSN